MTTTTSLIPFDNNPTARHIVEDNSLLEIDQELDALLERIEDEIEEHGEASKEAMDRLQVFAEAMNLKVNRIGRYISVMETRAGYCRKEAERLADRARHTESKIERIRQMVLYYLASHDLKQIESDEFTLRRQKNGQDSVDESAECASGATGNRAGSFRQIIGTVSHRDQERGRQWRRSRRSGNQAALSSAHYVKFHGGQEMDVDRILREAGRWGKYQMICAMSYWPINTGKDSERPDME